MLYEAVVMLLFLRPNTTQDITNISWCKHRFERAEFRKLTLIVGWGKSSLMKRGMCMSKSESTIKWQGMWVCISRWDIDTRREHQDLETLHVWLSCICPGKKIHQENTPQNPCKGREPTSLCASLRFPCTCTRLNTAMGSLALTSPDAILHSCLSSARVNVCVAVVLVFLLVCVLVYFAFQIYKHSCIHARESTFLLVFHV